MAGSLQDQLLNIGVVDKKKVKKSQHQQRKNDNKARQAVKSGKKLEPRMTQQQIEQSAREKQRRDLELNKQRDAERAEKALLAEVRQIILQHTVAIPKEADVAYNFGRDNKIKTIYTTVEQQKQLILGQLAIAVFAEGHVLIPDKIAEKIESRLPDMVIRIKPEKVLNEGDPYANYHIPDDLMW